MMSVFCSNSLIHAPECGKCILRDPKFSGGACPRTPLEARALQPSLKTPSASFSISPPTSQILPSTPFLIENPDKRSVLTKKLLIIVYLTTETTETYSWTCMEITVSCLAALLAVEPRGSSGYGSFLPHETRHIINSAKIGSISRTKHRVRVADKDFQRQIKIDSLYFTWYFNILNIQQNITFSANIDC